MTPSKILQAARNNLNALTDTLWSDPELLTSLYLVELEMARRCRCIDNIYSTTSVASTAEYTKPSRSIEIWQVTYNGKPLQEISYREYFSINPNSTSSSGTPMYYAYVDEAFMLYPTPDTAGMAIKVWSYDEPQEAAVTSVLDTPSAYHDVLVSGLTSKMCPKDLGHPLTLYWKSEFNNGLAQIEAFAKRRRRANKFAVTKNEDTLNSTEFGMV